MKEIHCLNDWLWLCVYRLFKDCSVVEVFIPWDRQRGKPGPYFGFVSIRDEGDNLEQALKHDGTHTHPHAHTRPHTQTHTHIRTHRHTPFTLFPFDASKPVPPPLQGTKCLLLRRCHRWPSA